MPDEKERFLNVEEATSRLLDDLELLKKQIGAYERKGKALGDTLDQLRSASECIGQLAERSRAIIETVEQIDTATILVSVDSLREQNADIRDGVCQWADQAKDIHTMLARQMKEYRASIDGLREQNADIRDGVCQWADQAKDMHTMLARQMKEYRQYATEHVEEMQRLLATKIGGTDQFVEQAEERHRDAMGKLRETLASSQKAIKDDIREANTQTAGEVAAIQLAIDRGIRRLTLVLVVGSPTIAVLAAVGAVLLLTLIQ